MSQRKPMGAFWAILAVPDHVLSGRRSVLLARMFLLDNGSRGCNASAAVLASYTGLTERSVETYRGKLADLGLVYRVHGTRGWHVNLPTGMPADRAPDAEILAYTRRIVAAIAPTESTPSVVLERESESTTPRDEVRPASGESTISVVDKYDQHRTDTEVESTPSVVESVATTITTPVAGLMSTHETHDKGTHELRQQQTHECDESHVEPTRENGNGNSASRSGDSKPSVRGLIQRLAEQMTVNDESLEQKRERLRAMARQK